MIQRLIEFLCGLRGHHGLTTYWDDCDNCGVEDARQITLCPNCGPVRQHPCVICKKEYP